MDQHSPAWRRRIAMALILLIAAALFAATKFASTAWIHKRRQLAQQWVRNGDREGLESRPREAVVSYRNALLYDDDPAVRFRMSRAMIAAGDTSEAEAYLLSLLSEEPGNADYNLALGRLFASQQTPTQSSGPSPNRSLTRSLTQSLAQSLIQSSNQPSNEEKAIAYYRAALLGRWQSAPIEHRLETNLELVRLLLKNHRNTDARATLLSLTSEMPKDTATQVEIAHLFVQAGDRNEAAAITQQVLHQVPEDAALRAFYASLLLHSGEFRRALQQFQLASEHTPLTADMQAQFDIAQQADMLDPFARGIRLKQQSARLQAILKQTQHRFPMCASSSPGLQKISQLIQAASRKNLSVHPETVDQIVNFAAAAEQSMSTCPLRDPADVAIQLIGKQQ